MRSFGFPKMLNSINANIIKDNEATRSNYKLLVMTEKGELLGDPYFGLSIKKYLFEQNNKLLADIVIDDIYTATALFMPQMKVNRNDITITQNKDTLYCTVKAINKLDFTTNLYTLVLFENEE
jgi:phage baseplate assembly protein W